MFKQKYFLSSLESTIFEPTRECSFLKKLHFGTGKECVLVEINPPVIGQQFGVSEDIQYVILANRHEGEHLFPISEFPCFVYIARSVIDDIFSRFEIEKSDVVILAWGELYKTRSDADNHVF